MMLHYVIYFFYTFFGFGCGLSIAAIERRSPMQLPLQKDTPLAASSDTTQLEGNFRED